MWELVWDEARERAVRGVRGNLGNHAISDLVSSNEIATPQGGWEDWK